jgi:hypothetical protein
MPSRNRVQQKTAKGQTATRPAGSKPRVRKLSFEKEPWYAEAARKMSASRKAAELQEVPAAPLAPD